MRGATRRALENLVTLCLEEQARAAACSPATSTTATGATTRPACSSRRRWRACARPAPRWCGFAATTTRRARSRTTSRSADHCHELSRKTPETLAVRGARRRGARPGLRHARRHRGPERALSGARARRAQHRAACTPRSTAGAGHAPYAPCDVAALCAARLRLLGARPRAPARGRARERALRGVSGQPAGPPRARRRAKRAPRWSTWTTARSRASSTARSTWCAFAGSMWT